MHFVGAAPSRKYAELHLSFSSAMFLTLLHFVNASYGAGEPAPRSVRSPQVVATTVGVRRAARDAMEIFPGMPAIAGKEKFTAPLDGRFGSALR